MDGPSRKERLNVIIIAGVIGLLATVFQCLPELWQESLRYDRNHASQVWRFLSGQVLHLGWIHLFMNLAGLILITALFMPEWNTRNYLMAFFISGLIMSTGIHLFSPHLIWYVGLSGILHGLLAAGAVYSYRSQPAFAMGLLIIVIIKIIWEQVSETSIGTEQLIGGKVAYDAHLYGFVGGLAAAALYSLTNRSKHHA